MYYSPLLLPVYSSPSPEALEPFFYSLPPEGFKKEAQRVVEHPCNSGEAGIPRPSNTRNLSHF